MRRGVGRSAESRLSIGETSGAPNKRELSGVKTLLVTVRPKALIEEPMSGNMEVAGRTMDGGLKEGGVDVVGSPVLSRLRYLTTPLNSVAHTCRTLLCCLISSVNWSCILCISSANRSCTSWISRPRDASADSPRSTRRWSSSYRSWTSCRSRSLRAPISDRIWAMVVSNWSVWPGLGWIGGVGDLVEMLGGRGSGESRMSSSEAITGDGGGVRSMPGSTQWSAGESEADAGAGVISSLPGSSQWSAGKSSADANGGRAGAGVFPSAISISSSASSSSTIGLGSCSMKRS
jgi:hypothetical protein